MNYKYVVIYKEFSVAHDSFARMTTDAEAGLSITYNALDLPETVSMGNTLKAKYTYLSDGTKVSALDASGAGLVYRGPFTYRRSSGGTLTFESAPFDRGRFTEAGIRYHVTDHLGSVRAVIYGNASTTTYPLTGFYSVDDFAPFGTKSTSSASSYLSLASTGSTVSLRDGFTGQEDQLPDFSIGYSDFGARHYSPTLSRWLVPDPMGEKYYDVSPYVYCAGNPVSAIDMEGRKIIFVNGFLELGFIKGGEQYWPKSFVSGAQSFYREDSSPYFTNRHYWLLSTAEDRRISGYNYAKKHYSSIISGMDSSQTFKIVSHSMGGAFSMGIKEYLEEHGWEVESSVFINAYQSDKIHMEENDSTFSIDYQNTNDPVLFWFDPNLGKGEIMNSELKIRVESDRIFKYIHSGPISSGEKFWEELRMIIEQQFE